MNQVTTDIKDFFSDRFGSPFWISTVISWLIWNWKLTVTAIFQSEKFSVAVVEEYFKSTPVEIHLIAPVVCGLIYAIGSGLMKESLEIAAKLLRSKLIELDSSGKLYKTVSMEFHRNQLSKLQRQIKRIESDKSVIDELSSQNDELYLKLEDVEKKSDAVTNLIKELAIEDTLNTEQKKANFIELLHKEQFALTITKDNIPKNDSKNTNIETPDTPPIIRSGISASTSRVVSPLARELKTYEFDALRDPSSLKTLYLSLLILNNNTRKKEDLEPELLGIPKEVFQKCFQTAKEAKFITENDDVPGLSAIGVRKLLDLEGKLKTTPTLQILKKHKSNAIEEIVQKLKDRSVSKEDLISSLNYHPELNDLLDSLIDENTIKEEGGLLFMTK